MMVSNFYCELSQTIKGDQKFKEAFEHMCSEVTLKSLGFKQEITLEKTLAKKLIETAGIFALSTDEDKVTALKVLNSLLICGISEEFKLAINILLMRLGNFPTINMLEGAFNLQNPDSALSIDMNLRGELERRYAKNILSDDVLLTDFQSDLLTKLFNGESVSFSAPTSAGKTYIIIEYLVNRFKNDDEINACIIVPTKALISQLLLDFTEKFEENNINDVLIITTTAQLDQLLVSGNKRLFILTQERLQYLLFFNVDVRLGLNVLIVDEAQKINDDARGIILESTLLEAIRRNPDTQLICSAPLADNPGRLSVVLQRDQNVLKSDFSPVPQFIYDVRIFRRKLQLKILIDGEFKSIETNVSLVKPSGKFKEIAFLSNYLGKDQMNIIFSNGPSAARKIAEALMEYTTPIESDNINDFKEFIDDEIHPLYKLKKYLEHGIAYHYSSMPMYIRNKVEELYKLQEINYLCCTSTLLEGVNLPARNIFVHNPQEGTGNPMTNQNFWNLIGRAGRLTKELAGSVFCINTNEWGGEQFNSRRHYLIKSATEGVLQTYPQEFVEYLTDIDAILDKERLFETCTSTFVRRIITNENDSVKEYIRSRGIEEIPDRLITDIDAKLLLIKQDLQIPLEVFERNSSIDPRKQQKLYDFFIENFANIGDYLPLHPRNNAFNTNLKLIFSTVDRILFGRNNNTFKYAANIASQWIKEKSFKEIVQNQIGFKTRDLDPATKEALSNNEQFVNEVIDDLIQTINKTLVFHYARLTQCYIDILNVVLRRLDMDEVDYALPVSIEYGIFEPTSQVTISKGGSRSLAIRLTKLYKERPQTVDFSDWVHRNRRMILDVLPRTMHEEFLHTFAQ
jgi:superfamily II DNA/RNA helicase